MNLPEGVNARYSGLSLTMKGPKGEAVRKLFAPGVRIKAEGSKVMIEYGKKAGKKAKKLVGSLTAHLKNMARGVTEGHVYKMKICSGHFPMNVTVSGNEMVIKNFFGEKWPRKVKIGPAVKVKVDGADITVESADKEAASQFAASVEQMTKRTQFDRRIFMDGIYITSKDGKEIK